MPATTTSPLPSLPMNGLTRLPWLRISLASSGGLALITALLRPDLTALICGFSLLLVASALIGHALCEPTPRRLTPIGLAGKLAVKLTGSSVLVGRLPCCRVEIPLPTVSSHHCRLSKRGSRWFIEDLDSRNGTFVNNRRIRKKRVRVGDKISVAEFSFRVE